MVGSLGRGGGGGGGWLEVFAVRCDSANFVKTSQYPPPMPLLQGNRQTLDMVYKLS